MQMNSRKQRKLNRKFMYRVYLLRGHAVLRQSSKHFYSALMELFCMFIIIGAVIRQFSTIAANKYFSI